jgi:hypothetical protein
MRYPDLDPDFSWLVFEARAAFPSIVVHRSTTLVRTTRLSA